MAEVGRNTKKNSSWLKEIQEIKQINMNYDSGLHPELESPPFF
jgi:hypothetical protein